MVNTALGKFYGALRVFIFLESLGSCLWFVYAETYKQIESHLHHRHTTLVSAISGGVAGGTQAVLAAPAENVRILLENGSSQGSWKTVWHEAFKGTETETSMKMQDARKTQAWVHEVRGMVGRGWEGWRIGVAKDVVGTWLFEGMKSSCL